MVGFASATRSYQSLEGLLLSWDVHNDDAHNAVLDLHQGKTARCGLEFRRLGSSDGCSYGDRGYGHAEGAFQRPIAHAAASCEAVGRPTVRTLPVKTPEQQAQLMQHRVPDLLIRQRTHAINALRSQSLRCSSSMTFRARKAAGKTIDQYLLHEERCTER
jgi:hypothetical protein